MHKTNDLKEVACQNGTFRIEDLPYPVVLYPNHYGAFFAFKCQIDSSKSYLCECCKNAVLNFIYMVDLPNDDAYAIHNRTIKYQHNFPKEFLASLEIDNNGSYGKYIETHISELFLPILCHACNKKEPSLAYCNPMYGNKFKQTYGWYSIQKQLEIGIGSFAGKYYILPNKMPKDIQPLGERMQNIISLNDNKSIYQKEFSSLLSICIRTAINLTKDSFGIQRSEEKWKSETTLYKIITSLFSQDNVIFHYRADWLDKLEIDIFIYNKNIGIEYQGIQHFFPVEHWGGKEGLKKRQANDIKKEKLCKENNILLIYFDYKEVLTKEYVKSKIEKIMMTEGR